MPRTTDLLKRAAHKRDMAKQIKETAETLSKDILRERVIRQAERLEKEAASFERLAKTGSDHP